MFFSSTESGLSEADSNSVTNGSTEDSTERERVLREKVHNLFWILFNSDLTL